MPDLHVRAQTPQQLSEELAHGLRQLRTLVSATGATPLSPSASPDFDVLHPNCCRIVVLNKHWNTWEQALDEVGQKFQTFRSRRSPDYQNVKDVLSGKTNSLSTVHRAAFGLPIVFYYRSLGGQQGTLEGRTHERRASPLIIRVIRLTNGAHTVVMTVFKAVLLEDKGQLTLKQRGHAPVTAAPPDLGLLDMFLGNIGQSIPLLEVHW
jgi:CRISPR-associated protein Cmr1